jgi:hypothetical protein
MSFTPFRSYPVKRGTYSVEGCDKESILSHLSLFKDKKNGYSKKWLWNNRFCNKILLSGFYSSFDT